jgi:hypothetical protein
MIHGDVANQLQLLIKAVAPPLLEVAQAPLETPKWVPGQRLQATVLAGLANGRFQAQIGDQILDMNLPKNTQPGDKLDITFVTRQPRLTFVMSRDVSLPSGAKADVSISDTARFLGALLNKAASHAAGQEAAPLTKATPVLSAAPGSPVELAQALQKAVSQSGLFYESHQAQWVTGQRPLADLLQEPQAQLSRPELLRSQSGAEPARAHAAQGAAEAQMPGKSALQQLSRPELLLPQSGAEPASAHGAQSAAEAQTEAQMPAKSALQQLSRPELTQPQPGVEPVRAHAAQSAAEAQMPAKPALQNEPVHPQTAPLVRQQMELLDSRQVVWQGQIWPGQSMDWQIEERAAHERDPAESGEWQTSLHLDLPRLGDVTATLKLSALGIRLTFKVTEAATADTMRMHQSELQQSMSAAGLSLASLSVEAVDGKA